MNSKQIEKRRRQVFDKAGIMNNVVAVVVTYNRKELLMECLNAILSQTIKVREIVLVDNASTDGTYDCLQQQGYFEREDFIYLLQEKNVGGAGGFYAGMKYAASNNADWIWIMDDDTIPEEGCLEALLCAKDKFSTPVSFFASSVRGIDGSPMNVPMIDNRITKNGYQDWYLKLEEAMVKIKMATFVSLLINGNAVHECGLPCPDYFIWGDDSEYTLRLTKYYGDAYLVGKSKVCHKRITNQSVSVFNQSDKKRIKNSVYQYRNRFINSRLYSPLLETVFYTGKCVMQSCTLLFRGEFAKSQVILKGLFQGIIKYSYFKKWINSQIKR